MVVTQPLDILTQRRRQGAFLGRSFAIRKTHRRMRIADMQRPHVRHNIAPGGDLDLDTQASQYAGHIGNGLFQRQVFASDIGLRLGCRLHRQQGLRVGIQVSHFFNDKVRASLHHFFHRTAVYRTQNTNTVFFRNIGRQLDLYFENLLVAVFRVHNIVVRQADIVGGDIARAAIQLHKISRTQGRRSQKIIERARRRAIAFIADRLVGNHREVIKLGFQA